MEADQNLNGRENLRCTLTATTDRESLSSTPTCTVSFTCTMPESRHHKGGHSEGFLRLTGLDTQHEHHHIGHDGNGQQHSGHHARRQTYQDIIEDKFEKALYQFNWKIARRIGTENDYKLVIEPSTWGATDFESDQKMADKLSDVSSRHDLFYTSKATPMLIPQTLLQSILLTFTTTFLHIHRDHFTTNMTTSTKAARCRNNAYIPPLPKDIYSQCTT